MRILSNNIYWLQGYPSPNNAPDPAEPSILKELTACYASLMPDVFCLQEIQNQETSQMIAASLNKSTAYSSGHMFSQYGGAILADNVSFIDSAVNSKDESDRLWLLAELTTGTQNIKILTVHLPSDLNRGPVNAIQKRQEEIAHILAHQSADILCGDFNQPQNEWLSNIMQAHGYIDAAVYTGNESDTYPKTNRRIDYMWVKKEHQDRIKSFSTVKPEEFKSNVPGRNIISDHMPIVLDIDL